MDSDESYETTSDAMIEDEYDTDSNTSHVDDYQNQQTNISTNKLADENESIHYGSPTLFNAQENSNEMQYVFLLKIKEQSQQIQALKKERIGFLEQITNLCTTLEQKENELMDFMQLYEKKVTDISQYMSEVQHLLAQLGSLFPDRLIDYNVSPDHTSNNNEECLLDNISDSRVNNTHCNGISKSNNELINTLTKRDQRGRALLNALSESIATAVNATSSSAHCQKGSNEQTQTSANNTITEAKQLTKSDFDTDHLQITTDNCNTIDKIALAVQRLPAFCWSPDHVIYWLSEYVCLPGGCLDAARRIRLDGKQLTNVIDNKKEKLLCLNDAGLRRKFRLALEDLRVHGSPGVSRTPGPSHVDTNWICDIWLPDHLGLVQLVPYFAIRRIDGRLLSSLMHYKITKSNDTNYQQNRRSGPVLQISNPCENQNLCTEPITFITHGTNDRFSTGGLADVVKSDFGHLNNYRVADRKEMLRILFGIGRDPTVGTVNGSHNNSGADLPLMCKFILGKRETASLQTGLELLHKHNYNTKLLEQIRDRQQPPELDLIYWTNKHVKDWLINIGLKDYTQGIEASGLHGAYMALDPTFDLQRLLKHIRVPLTVANNYKLEEQLQSIIQPARQREGVCAKSHSIFRRRSMNRSGRINIMQQSMLCNSTSSASTANNNNLGSNQIKQPLTPDLSSGNNNNNMHELCDDSTTKQKSSLCLSGRYFQSGSSTIYTPQCEKRKAHHHHHNTNSECQSISSNSNHSGLNSTTTTTSCLTRVFQRNRSTGTSQSKLNDSNKADTISLLCTNNCDGTMEPLFDSIDDGSRSNTLVRKYSENTNTQLTESKDQTEKCAKPKLARNGSHQTATDKSILAKY